MVLEMARRSARLSLACAAAAVLVQGCSIDPYRPPQPQPVVAPAPPPPAFPSVGNEIAMRAISQLGKPYVWGGADLEGFDCSGLVRFIYDQVGIPVPRTAAEQFSAAKPIELAGLKPGDLLFFRTQGRRISHVAIYTGEGRFIHAPRTGSPVEFRMLDDEYYRARLAGAGRFL
jgi:cell wall-associated NlpC family hydrolase